MWRMYKSLSTQRNYYNFSKDKKKINFVKKSIGGCNLMKKFTICIIMFAISALVLAGCTNDNKIKMKWIICLMQ